MPDPLLNSHHQRGHIVENSGRVLRPRSIPARLAVRAMRLGTCPTLIGVLSACAAPSPAPPAEAVGASVVAPGPAAPVVISEEPWTYNNRPGKIIRTEHYRFFTTNSSALLMGRLPAFMESALANYRSAVGPLPPPPMMLDTFLMANRAEWSRLTQELMGPQAEVFLRIPRGGYAAGGRGVFYDIGAQDTLSIAAHEGWHQYTQRTFKETMPIWLEEGIATTMEGHRWDGSTPLFLSWSNLERFDQLRAAAAKGSLFSLQDLLTTSPQELLTPPASPSPPKAGAPKGPRSIGTDAALTYYAQIWALVQFLKEGENGKYSALLRLLVSDAAAGRMGRAIAASADAPPGRATGMLSRQGAVVFAVYFTSDLDRAGHEYARFIEQIVRSGTRGLILDGRSPIQSGLAP
jgi:hypothetical protein